MNRLEKKKKPLISRGSFKITPLDFLPWCFLSQPSSFTRECSVSIIDLWLLTLYSSVFRTSHTDVNTNETSSYVDLSPLYGHNQEAQDRVRDRRGRGLLYPDVFAEDRLLLLPPAVCALLVLFSRNHNVCTLSPVIDLVWMLTCLSWNYSISRRSC